ncbi:MAG: (2Fe-2S) ferredoxin domain-containing protein [Clostridia bacterium]|nr:(2Fe-2S) ferredoxin domain-containing protein [Clostridia bacterium]
MKSLAELQAIKDKMKNKVVLREGNNELRVVVGMATCGIAAGARPVLNTIVEAVNEGGLADKVTVSQTGCIGLCQFEPIVEIHEAGKEKVTYVKVDTDKAKRIIEEHIKGGKVIAEFTLSDLK